MIFIPSDRTYSHFISNKMSSKFWWNDFHCRMIYDELIESNHQPWTVVENDDFSWFWAVHEKIKRSDFWWKMKGIQKAKQIILKIIDWFLVEPKRLVRLIVLSICSIVVFFQLWECVMKLLHPPISTASHFDLNRTMHYPAVTFCRNPAFKPDVMKVNIQVENH